MKGKRSSLGNGLLISPVLFFLFAFLLPAVREGDGRFYALAGIWSFFILGSGILFPRLFRLDRLLLTIVNVFTGMLPLLTSLTDMNLQMGYWVELGVGYALMIAACSLARTGSEALSFRLLLLLPALVLMVLPQIVPLSFGTGFLSCVILLFPFAALLKMRHFLIAGLMSLASLSLLLWQGEWAPALSWAAVVSLLLWTSSGSWIILLISALSGFGLTGLFLRISPSLLWESLPRLPASEDAAAFSGGLFGTGPGLSSALSGLKGNVLWPLLTIQEQFGSIFLCCLLLLFAVFLARCVSGACDARKELPALECMGAVILLAARVLIVLASGLGWLPLPSAGFPLLSSDPAVLLPDLFLAGWIAGVIARNRADLEEDTHLAMLSH